MLAATMHRTLEELRERIEAALAGLNADQTQRRPGPENWSTQQIIEHLIMTFGSSAENFEARVAKGTGTRAKPTLLNQAGQFYLCTLGLFPKGRKAPAMVEPGATTEPASGTALMAKAHAALERFDAAAAAAERLFHQRPAIVHPVLGPMSVDRWRRFHLVHGKHHLRQVKALRTA